MSSVSAIGALPPVITLDDVAALAAADEHHRYELSREGVLLVMPPPRPEHAVTVARLIHWFHSHGYGPEQVIPDCGIDVGGGRQPDLTIWAKGCPPRSARSVYAGVDGLLLVVEVVSPETEATDRVIKRDEYHAAGVPRYWIVGNDKANTVQMLARAADGYRVEREVALARLLTEPAPVFV